MKLKYKEILLFGKSLRKKLKLLKDQGKSGKRKFIANELSFP